MQLQKEQCYLGHEADYMRKDKTYFLSFSYNYWGLHCVRYYFDIGVSQMADVLLLKAASPSQEIASPPSKKRL